MKVISVEGMKFEGTVKSAQAFVEWANAKPWPVPDEPNASYVYQDGSELCDDLLIAVDDENWPVQKDDWVFYTPEGFKVVSHG